MTPGSGIRTIAVVLAAAVALGACVPHHGPKEAGGTLVGAATGGLLGAQIGRGSGQLAAVAAGTLLGAFVGNSVGRSLDAADRLYAERAAHDAFEYSRAGSVSSWRNPDTGHYGTVQPLRTYQTPAGRYCREYQQTVTVGGRTQRAYGTACRQPDGSWEIVNAS